MNTIKNVYIIKEGKKTNTWIQVGVAFVNKDNSLNVVLDCLPIDGKLQIRDRKAKQEKEG